MPFQGETWQGWETMKRVISLGGQLSGSARRPSSCWPPRALESPGPGRGGSCPAGPTYCGFPHADPRLRHRFGRFCFNHLSCRGAHCPGLLGLQGQLIGHLEGLPQRQDDLVGQVLGGSRSPLKRLVQEPLHPCPHPHPEHTGSIWGKKRTLVLKRHNLSITHCFLLQDFMG